MSSTPAVQKRYAGIGAVNDAVVAAVEIDGRLQNVWHKGEADRAEVAGLIRALDALGRTERWKATVERWALMVEETENPFEWAFFQGGIYTGYAAD